MYARIALATAALALAACGTFSSESHDANTPATTSNTSPSPNAQQPTARGGGPSTLHPDPTVDLGGQADDDMNSSPATEGVAPTEEQPSKEQQEKGKR